MPFKDQEARRDYMRNYRAKQKREAEEGITSGSVNPPSKPVPGWAQEADTRATVRKESDPIPVNPELMLEAANAVLERKGIPGVRKGAEPALPFDKKTQASRKRM